VDVAAEADDIAEAEIGKIGEQLVITEAAVGQDGDTAAKRDELCQSQQAGILEVVALVLQLILPH